VSEQVEQPVPVDVHHRGVATVFRQHRQLGAEVQSIRVHFHHVEVLSAEQDDRHHARATRLDRVVFRPGHHVDIDR
jgi:hypothetical protein